MKLSKTNQQLHGTDSHKHGLGLAPSSEELWWSFASWVVH